MEPTYQHDNTISLIHRANANHTTPHSIASRAVSALQKKSIEDEELQTKPANSMDGIFQRKDEVASPKANRTGMPDQLKAGIENLSGFSMDDVRVHYNSGKPVQLNALAYAQGTDIHIAPGQEKHLPHEAWHVVQQKQGRVKPIMQMKDKVNINDDAGSEKETDEMGSKALRIKTTVNTNSVTEDNKVAKSIAIQNMSKRAEQSNQKITYPKTDIVQRKITVGILKYDADQAETRVKSENIGWKESYHQVLKSLDAKDERFKNIEELITNLKLNGDHLEAYKSEATTAWVPYGYIPGTGDSLHDLAFNVIENAIRDKTVIGEMSYDKIFKYTPETQLAYCLWECRADSEAVLALCLYTSYFYEPLNKYLRGQSVPNADTDFGRLLIKTAQILKEAYHTQEATQIENKRYKLELKSGWIGDNIESINFKALTSTHPNLSGVKAMWGDIAKGTFGDYDNFALLIFEGTAKIIRPEKKYFPGESEDLMGPESIYNVFDRYDIKGEIPGIGNKTIRVFHLSNMGNKGGALQKVSFSDVV